MLLLPFGADDCIFVPCARCVPASIRRRCASCLPIFVRRWSSVRAQTILGSSPASVIPDLEVMSRSVRFYEFLISEGVCCFSHLLLMPAFLFLALRVCLVRSPLLFDAHSVAG